MSTAEPGPHLLVHPGLELTWIGRAPGPLHTGIRLGLGQLDREVTDGMSGETPMDHTTVTRLLLPEVSSVLRLDPFQGRFRPFLEGELGLAATVLDERTLDADGNRTAYRFRPMMPRRTTAGPPVFASNWAKGLSSRPATGAGSAVPSTCMNPT